MSVNTQTNGFMFEIIDLVEMLQESITNDEQISTASFHLILVDSKLAFVTFCLMQVLRWWNLKGLSTYL
jgi:hypothetical protein